MASRDFLADVQRVWMESIREKLTFLIPCVALLFPVWWLFRAAYYLRVHPLAVFPGPKSAAISTWWLYRLDKGQKQEPTLEELHRKYKTRALRIGPNELHIDDVNLHQEIYSPSYRYLKEPYFYAGFNEGKTSFTEDDPFFHRQRQKLLNPYFSRKAILNTQPFIISKINALCSKFSAFKSQGSIHLHQALRCLTVDIITAYSFPEPFACLENAKDGRFVASYLQAFDEASTAHVVFRYFPIIKAIANISPTWLVAAIDPKAKKFLDMFLSVEDAVLDYRESPPVEMKWYGQWPVLQSLRELSPLQMLEEALNVIIAGSDTTGTTLTIGIYHIMTNPDILRRLTSTLDDAMPDKNQACTLLQLESLDYLTACVKESLRCAMVVPGRLPRVVPRPSSGVAPLVIDGKTVPPGTIVGMSAYTMHNSEEIWGEDARLFRPERWLHPNAKQLDKYLVSFSKGARACLGQNLAYAELRMAIATLFRRFKFSLDETMQSEDLEELDCFTKCFRGTGVRVFVEERD